MTRDELLALLRSLPEIARDDPKQASVRAINGLLVYLNDDEIGEAYCAVPKDTDPVYGVSPVERALIAAQLADDLERWAKALRDWK